MHSNAQALPLKETEKHIPGLHACPLQRGYYRKLCISENLARLLLRGYVGLQNFFLYNDWSVLVHLEFLRLGTPIQNMSACRKSFKSFKSSCVLSGIW